MFPKKNEKHKNKQSIFLAPLMNKIEMASFSGQATLTNKVNVHVTKLILIPLKLFTQKSRNQK